MKLKNHDIIKGKLVQESVEAENRANYEHLNSNLTALSARGLCQIWIEVK